ncbi:MAG: 5'/3'-nucleotidase SurE [Chloroflexota bacterium]
MHILLTSDMGIYSAPMFSLAERLGVLGEVTVWASEQDWSQPEVAVAGSLRVTACRLPSGLKAWRCTGTPVQCVSLALSLLAPQTIDLIISGINIVPTTPVVKYYSGGLAAAGEGVRLGVPGIAVSMAHKPRQRDGYEVAVEAAYQAVADLMADGLSVGVYKVMVPAPKQVGKHREQHLYDCYQALQTKREPHRRHDARLKCRGVWSG